MTVFRLSRGVRGVTRIWCLVWRIVVFSLCVQVVVGGGIWECKRVWDTLDIHFQSDSSHVRGNFTAPSQSLCSPGNSTAASACCPDSLVGVKSSSVVLSAFNNTEQFGRFKTKISGYEELILSHQCSNVELWNATIDGLRVLRNWGVKYWDPAYLLRNHVFSDECVRKVVAGGVCGTCVAKQQDTFVKQCKSLCHNVVIGCLKPFSEYIESPWKHAVSSVRTAIRLVITTGGEAKQNTQPLQELVSDLNDWREPVTWWISDYKRTVSCEGLPTSGCWNGEAVGKYEFATANWKSQYNPEFGEFVGGYGGMIHPNVIVELDRFRNELVSVRKSLEKYWPTTPPVRSPPPHALALSSSESLSPPRSSYLHDLVPDSGSGDDAFDSDDEDIEYSNSGYGPRVSVTDDEDLLDGYGSGSGDGSDDLPPTPNNPIKVTDGLDITPVSISGSGDYRISPVLCCVVAMLLVAW